jgi:hypothetical protein
VTAAGKTLFTHHTIGGDTACFGRIRPRLPGVVEREQQLYQSLAANCSQDYSLGGQW